MRILLFWFYSMCAWADYQGDTWSLEEVMPKEELVLESISDATKFLDVYYPNQGQYYRLRTGIGCFKSLLHPEEILKIEASGFGEFIMNSNFTQKTYPMLWITTIYGKETCKVIAIEGIERK